MAERKLRLQEEAERKQAALRAKVEASTVAAQARLEKDAKENLRQLNTQFESFETKMQTQKERKAEKQRLWLWQLEQERLRQEAADAKARAGNLLAPCSQLGGSLLAAC